MSVVSEGRARRAAERPAVGGHIPETLLPDLEELGLNGSQARVLLALLQLGSGNSSEIARLAQVPRTAVYPVLQELEAKRLVGRVGAEGPALWSSPGRNEVLDRLESGHEARIREQRLRVGRVRSTIEELVPAGPPGSPPIVHVIPGPAHAKEAYDQVLERAPTNAEAAAQVKRLK